jgi:hypothetical protein
MRDPMKGLSAAALLCAAAALLAAVPAAMPSASARAPAPGVDARTLWSRVHFIGASASAGFGVRTPGSRPGASRGEAMTLARVAGLARLDAGEVTGDATGMFFMSPLATGEAQVGQALAMDPPPTLVVAADFLFWFTYGATDAERRPVRDESQRLGTLERGLELLGRIDAKGIPLVVGDVPDMSPAVGRMLSRAQMPDLGTIELANARIREWARGRPRVAVLPLARLVADLRSGEPFAAGRRSWSERADGPLIQRDQLHPTFAGTVALLARSEQAANDRLLGIRQPNSPGAPAAFEHDPASVAERARLEAADAAQRARPSP